jgi:protein SCO1/2
MNPARKVLAIAFLFLASSGVAVLSYVALHINRSQPEYATVLPAPIALPEFSLLDHTGQIFDRGSLRGNWNVVFFGFTHCPDICPATLQQLALARKRVAEDGKEFPRILFISVDPERDTPEAMASYIANFGPGIAGISGSLHELTKLTKATGIYFAKSGDLDAAYSVDHSAVVLVINPNAEWQALFSAPHNIDEFVNDIPIITGRDI